MNTNPTRWRSQTAFVFAAAAAAIGLGNIWRFPYLAGENGGGAFVLIYLLFVIVLGIPLMTGEVVLGRIGRKNPVGTFFNIAQTLKRSRHWRLLGGLSVLASFLILSYYLVITGWVLDYFFHAILGHSSIHGFKTLQHSFWRMFISDTLIALTTMGVICLGIKRGLERTVMFMFPAFLILMLILLMYSITTANFGKAVGFLFHPHFTQVTSKTILLALGQAFFSLNIGMGIIIMFSAYLPKKVPLVSSIFAIVFADTAIALLAGLIIFPIVFANDLSAAAGPSLIFKTLPLAFNDIPLGNVMSALFFLLLLFAAFTSCIALLEVSAAWLTENHNLSRTTAGIIAGSVCWLFSLGTIASFSDAQVFSIHGVTFFQAIDFLTSGIMLPLGGMLIALFTGWLLPKPFIHDKIAWNINNRWFLCWRWIERYLAPIAIFFILLNSLGIF